MTTLSPIAIRSLTEQVIVCRASRCVIREHQSIDAPCMSTPWCSRIVMPKPVASETDVFLCLQSCADDDVLRFRLDSSGDVEMSFKRGDWRAFADRDALWLQTMLRQMFRKPPISRIRSQVAILAKINTHNDNVRAARVAANDATAGAGQKD
jgi:hypothetical protein